MKYTFGLIGAGNMGGAIARAVSRSVRDGVLVDRDEARAAALAADLGFTAVTQEEAARECRYLYLGVKPHLAAGVLAELVPTLAAREEPPVLVSMAAGVGALLDREYFETCRAEIQTVRAWTAAHLRDMGFVMPESCANFLFAKHSSVGGQALYLALKERGVLVRHFETPLLRDFNRITIGSAEQMQQFLRILCEVLEVLT